MSLNKRLTLSTIAMTSLLASPIYAEPVCNETAVINEVLSEYSERREFTGLTTNSALAHFYFNAETTSWSFVISYSNGWSCIMFSGKHGVVKD